MQVITLSPADVDEIVYQLNYAIANERRVRVAVEDGFKIAVGGGAWSLPYGTDTTGQS